VGSKEVTLEMANEFVEKHKLDHWIETSAKANDNVDDLFTLCAQILYDRFKDSTTEKNKNIDGLDS